MPQELNRVAILSAEQGWSFNLQAGCLVARHATHAPLCVTIPLTEVVIMTGAPSVPPKKAT